MFCKKCGYEIQDENSVFCEKCGNRIENAVPKPVEQQYVPPQAPSEPAGIPATTPKDKTIAVLLAIFLGPITWTYTYKKTAAKFWIGAVLMVLGLILTFALIGFLIILGIGIWCIVDTAIKPEEWYRNFPNG